jgi:hypothetical protein
MWSFIELWVVAPFLVLMASFQLGLAALTQTTIFLCRYCSASTSDAVSLAHDPLMFYVTLIQAAAFFAWASWIYAK